MKKILKRLCTGFLALATVVTALPTTPVHAESKQYWTESAERVGIIEKVMNDGSMLIGIILIFMGCDIFSKPTKEMQILENDERNIAITNASLANAYKVTLTLLVLVLFALVFMGYMSKVVFFSIAGVIAIGQITWVITARYLDKNTS